MNQLEGSLGTKTFRNSMAVFGQSKIKGVALVELHLSPDPAADGPLLHDHIQLTANF
jgi:hypothetical protein